MSYDTLYSFEVANVSALDRNMIEICVEYSDIYALQTMCREEYYYGSWRNYRHDMTEISKQFSHALFIIDGVGEEHPDIWRDYFQNGKYYRDEAEIIFKEFDPNKFEKEH